MIYILMLINFIMFIRLFRKSNIILITMTVKKHREKLSKSFIDLNKLIKGDEIKLLLYLSILSTMLITYITALTANIDKYGFYIIGTIMGIVQLVDCTLIFMFLVVYKNNGPWVKYVILDKVNTLLNMTFCGISSLLLIQKIIN